jgi:hypothetical protein
MFHLLFHSWIQSFPTWVFHLLSSLPLINYHTTAFINNAVRIQHNPEMLVAVVGVLL